MKHSLSLLLALGLSLSAHASDGAAPPADAQLAEAPARSLVVPADGPVRAAVVEASPEQVAQKPSIARTLGIEGNFLPFLSINGRVGASVLGDRVEAGLEAGGSANTVVLGLVGGYLQLAPIPGEIGKRFYVKGKAYLAFTLQEVDRQWIPARDELVGATVGYRHMDLATDPSFYWYVEGGALKLFGDVSRFPVSPRSHDPDPVIPSVSVGGTWR